MDGVLPIAEPDAAAEAAPGRRIVPLSGHTLLTLSALALFAAAWQIASYVAPAYAVPSWGRIIQAMLTLSPADIIVTVLRVVVSMVASFVAGLAFSLLVFDRPRLEAFLFPYIRLLMAVPAVCWVVFAILWFKGVEFRIFFVMCVSCAPVFAVDSLDAMKSVPADLRQMVNSFRPDPWQRFIKIILPGIVPNLLTSWKVNFTLAIRIVTIAELVGALSGIGHGLEMAQEMFSVAVVFAWTLVLVGILLVFEFAIGVVEHRALRWRHA